MIDALPRPPVKQPSPPASPCPIPLAAIMIIASVCLRPVNARKTAFNATFHQSAFMTDPRPTPTPGSTSALARHWRLLALGLILLAGAALRMTDLEHVPYGIWFDEAINGMDAVNVWRPGG